MRALDPRLLARTKSVRPLLVVDCALGIGTAARCAARSDRCSRGSPREHSMARRCATLWPEFALLVIAFAVRGAFAWSMEVAGRRAAWSVLSDLRLALVERRLRAHPTSVDGAGGAEITAVSVQGVEALEGYFARYLPQVVLASIVPFLVIAWVAFLDLEAAVIMLLTLPLVPLFMWLIGTYTADRTRERWQALRAAVEPLPRRRAGPPDAAGIRPGTRRGGDRRRGERPVPPDDDGDAPDQLPVGLSARAGGDDRGSHRRGDGRASGSSTAASACRRGSP